MEPQDNEQEPPGAAPPNANEERPVFRHPQWMVGVVLIFAVIALVAGVEKPVFLLIGFPCILVLVIYVWVRFVRLR